VSGNDPFLSQHNPDLNYGGCTDLGIENKTGDIENALLYFSPPTLPTGATFTSANLDVYVSTARVGSTIDVRRG
jgi:hypothetical protein